MDKFFKFLVPAVVAAACAILAFLTSDRVTMAPGMVAGIYCGLATSLAWEFGRDNWTKESLYAICGGLVGGILGSLVAIG